MGKNSGSFNHFRTCNLCEAMCGLEIKVTDGTIESIKGDKDDPFSKGYICPKATGLQDIYEDPDRLKKPIKKTATGWEEIEWKEAFDLVEAGIKKVQQSHGPDALGIYQGNPNVHSLGAMLFSPGLVRALKTKNRFSATSVDQLPHHYASQFMLGHMSLLPVPDINRTDYFLCMGANPMVSNGSLMSAGGMPQRIKDLQARGGQMVVIDPRRSETAEKADKHVFIKPGADVFFLGSIIHEVLKAPHKKELLPFLKGFESLDGLFERLSPEHTQRLTGIAPEVVKAIAKEFLKAKSAVCYGRIGLSIQEHGVLCQWMTILLNIISGNFDQPGGAMLPTPAFDTIGTNGKGTYNKYNRWQSRVRALPELGGELPAATMAEDILTEGEGQIKAMLTIAGNPVLSTPNGTKLETALSSLEFMVSIDIYLNETTKHADIILPPATGLENDHYDIVFNSLAIHNVAKYSGALFEPSPGAMSDWKIFKALTKRFKKSTLQENLTEPLITPSFLLEKFFKQSGGLVSLKELKQKVHGIDLGPLKPRFPERLCTPDQKIDLVPELFVTGLEKLLSKIDVIPDHDLLLIGRRQLRSNNSWMHNSLRLVKGPKRCTLMIHPNDAEKRKIQNGDEVKVSSETGQLKISAEVTDEVMPGVVSIPHGWGHNREGTKWKIAEEHAGVSVNDLTDDQFIDKLSGNAVLGGVPVEVNLG